MGRFVERVQVLAMALGAPGIFLVAFLDSSILSLPEVADLLVIWMVTNNKSRIVIYVVSATLGSLLGCLLLYGIGKKGGAGFVHRRFGSTNVERALEAFRRHGIMAVLIPSILPPPAPFKIFVLLAGVADISVARFSTAILIGRGLRYTVEGLLALWYGERAIAFIRQNGTTIALAAVIIIAAGFLVYLRLSRSRPPAVDKLQ
jgi:membrane protein YqaA with SNARE-associated domain